MTSFLSLIKFLLTVSFLGAVGYGGLFLIEKYVWDEQNLPSANYTFTNRMGETPSSSVRHFEKETELNTDRPFAMLLLGVDTNDVKEGRSDTIILSVVDPKKGKVSMLSLPRDTRVQLYNSKKQDKINAAYAIGGVDLTAATISELFDLPIEHFAVVNFKGFSEMVDTIGGLQVDVEKNLSFPDRITNTSFKLSEGPQTLTGIEVLNYARFRSDEEGDFGRMRRQQQVMKEIVNQSVSLRNVPKLLSMLDVMGDNVNANIGFKDMASLAFKMRSVSGEDIESLPLEASTATIGGVSYVIIDDEEIDRLKTELHTLLAM